MQWSVELGALLTGAMLLAGGVGYLVAALRSIKSEADTVQQLAWAQGERDRHVDELARLKADMTAVQDALQRLEVDRGELRQQWLAEQEKSQGLSERLQQSEGLRQQLQVDKEALRQQFHEVEKRWEATQAELRGEHQRQQELQERLQSVHGELRAEREEAGRLRDELARESRRAKSLEVLEQSTREQLVEAKAALAEQSRVSSQWQESYKQLSIEHKELETTLDSREIHHREQLEQLKAARESLGREFENLANRIFEEKGKTFTTTSQASLDGLLKPFREQIEGFQRRINEVHDASLKGNSNLYAEIRKVLDVGLRMSAEANNLTSALKGDSQHRGAWGEAQLKRTLEMSGLVEDAHYEVQSSFRDAEGRQKQTDYLIKLPDGKHIIIDSKVSLIAYDRAVGAETPEQYQLALAEHTRAVKRHIDELASKDYINLIGVRSPSFVLMFMPIEPAYIEALKHSKDLFEYGYKKGIVLVSHTTLIPILRTVSNLWMIERSNAEAREISERAGEIYNQVCLVAERLGKLGNTLHAASSHYNNTVTALAGRQGLYGKVERFEQLSTRVSRTLPELEPVHMDFEADRLSLMIEPIEEPKVVEKPLEKAPVEAATDSGL